MVNFLSLLVKQSFSSLCLQRFFIALFLSIFLSNLAYANAVDHTLNIQEKNPHTIKQIQSTTLIVGSEQDFPPFATGLTDETAGGFTVELWKAVAAEAGLNYHIRVLPFTELLHEFKAGKLWNFNFT